MTGTIDQLFPAFDSVTQPVFFVRENTIVYSNPAAQRQLLLPGQPQPELPQDLDTQDPEVCTIPLPGGRFSACLRPFADGRLVFLQPDAASDSSDTLLQAQSLQSVARALRVPLSNLFGAVAESFPRLEELEDPGIQYQLSCINRALYQLMHLTCNLSDFSAAVQGQMTLSREKTELCEFFHEIYTRVLPLCEVAGVRLTCELPEKMFNARIDRQKIERCILNLLSNALRHADEPPTVCMRLQRAGRSALVQVSSEPGGFSSADLPDAFRRYATDAPLPDPSWGAGFGLPLTQHIVQLHGGAMMLHTPATGGAVAVFSLPLDSPGQALGSPLAGVDYAGGFRHELVELADVLPLSVFDTENVN